MDDRELLDEFVQARSQSAFRQLVERHLPVVYSAARRMVRDAHLAEEVAQSVFTTLAQKAESIRPPQVLGGWLYNTTRHFAMHAVRTEQRRREREQTAFAMQSLALAQAPADPGLAEHLEPAMAELDADDRDVLVLRFLADRALREVGAELGVSEEAARKRVSRALERLRAILESRGVTATTVLLATALTASTIAVPLGLGASITTTALTGAAVQTSAVVAAGKAITMTTLQKSLIAGALALAVSVGVGTYLVQHASAGKAASNAAATPANAGVRAAASANAVTGILKTPAGKPLPNAQVFLSTESAAVPIYAPPSGEVVSTVTGSDGRFSFPARPENRAVIVVSGEGYGEATVADLAGRPELTLQPWARVEGILRQGRKPLANQTIHLSRTRFGSKIEQQALRTVHDTTTKTDADGHYVFPRVAPGDTWISWRAEPGRYDVQYRYFHVEPGQALTADIGGRGRPVTGRAVLADGEAQVKFYGSVWPATSHQMRRPPNWAALSAEEQEALTAAWENSADARLYNQERCPIDFRLAADGTFTVPDLPAGNYRITVASWSGAPVSSRMISRGTAQISVPEMAGGRSDEPLAVGDITAYYVTPLRPGDPAPLFETSTFDGKPVKLSDYKGKHVLLHFWRSSVPESLEAIEDLKAAQAAWGKDQRFVLLGLNCDATLPPAQRYAADHKLTWTQCYLGERPDVFLRYRLRGPATLLIGPDGLILRPQLAGSGIAAALEESFAAK